MGIEVVVKVRRSPEAGKLKFKRLNAGVSGLAGLEKVLRFSSSCPTPRDSKLKVETFIVNNRIIK